MFIATDTVLFSVVVISGVVAAIGVNISSRAYRKLFESQKSRGLIGSFEGPEFEWTDVERELASFDKIHTAGWVVRQLKTIESIVPPDRFTQLEVKHAASIKRGYAMQFVLPLACIVVLFLMVFREL